MVTRWIFAGIVALLALQRLAELRLSRKNEARILAQGGIEVAPEQYRMMKVLHTSWFAAMLVEVFVLQRPFVPALSLCALCLLIAGQVFRYSAIRTLGWRWTVRVMILPGAEPVRSGIYRFIRHPNYLGVILEIAAVPLIHSAFITALVYSAANAVLLYSRVVTEEKALSVYNQYQQVFENQPRFFPVFHLRDRE